MRVDGAIVDVDVLAVGHIHQLIAGLHVSQALDQRLEDQELGHGQRDVVRLPQALMLDRVEA